MKLLYGSALLLLTITTVTSYNVLMMMTIGSRSHKNALDPIAEGLAKKGHQVRYFTISFAVTVKVFDLLVLRLEKERYFRKICNI